MRLNRRNLGDKKTNRKTLLTARSEVEQQVPERATVGTLRMRLSNDDWALLTEKSLATSDFQRENLSNMACIGGEKLRD